MKTYRFDIFVCGRYKATLVIKAPPRWVFGEEELVAEAESRYPSLRKEKWSFGLVL